MPATDPTDDRALLRQFATENSEAAFATLVARHIGLVHSAALRQTGDPHAAEEITQAVFIILARKAGSLGGKVVLPGWLYHTARLTAANYLRTEIRRARREQEAHMNSLDNETTADDATWQQIAPLLDTAMGGLNEADRNAIVLRFFENKSMGEIAATLDAPEATARKRVTRAVERLRKFFTRRGVTLTAAAIAGAVSANSVQAAPVGLAKTISVVAIAKGAAAAGSTLTLVKGALKVMVWTKAKMTIAVTTVVLLAAGMATIVIRENISVAIKEPSWTSDPWQNLSMVWLAMDDFGKQSANSLNVDSSFAEIQKANEPINEIYRNFFEHVPVGAQIRQTPVNEKGNGVLSYSENKIAGTAASFSKLLAIAYGNNGRDYSVSRMILPTNLPEGNFDYLVNSPDHGSESFQAEIKKQFGFVGRKEMRETNVLLLKVKNPDVLSLMSQSMKTAAGYDLKTYWTRAENMHSLPSTLESDYFHQPVLDETGLTKNKTGFWGSIFIALPRNSSDLDLTRKALRDQLGLELVPSREPVEMLVVEKVK